MKQKPLKLKTKNIKARVEKDIQPFLDRLSKKKYIEGIVLLGGLGQRNFLDAYSDVDVAIFYDTKTPKKYFLPFEYHLVINGIRYEFNIHQVFFKKQKNIEWDEGTREAYSRAKVILDRKGRLKDLIHEKTIFDETTSYKRLMWIIQQYVWRAQIHSIRSYKRGYPEVSHSLLNECQELLVEAIYILNKRHRGHTKWKIAMVTTMNIIPDNFFIHLREAMKIKGYTLSDINRRIKYLNYIYNDIVFLARKLYPDFPQDLYRYYYKNFYQLTKSTFQQSYAENYSNRLSKQELEQLEGLLCFNLVSTKQEARKYLNKITGA